MYTAQNPKLNMQLPHFTPQYFNREMLNNTSVNGFRVTKFTNWADHLGGFLV